MLDLQVLHLQDSNLKELNILIKENHLGKTSEIIEPTVITVEKNRTVEVALKLRTKLQNNLQPKSKVKNKIIEEVWFSSMDITYA